MNEAEWQEVKDFVFATYANENRTVDEVTECNGNIFADVTERGCPKVIYAGGVADVRVRARRHKLSTVKRFGLRHCGNFEGYWLFELYPDDDNGIIGSSNDLLRYISGINTCVVKALVSEYAWDRNNNDVKLLLGAGFERCEDWAGNVCYTQTEHKEN